jgi:hypothetical protein
MSVGITLLMGYHVDVVHLFISYLIVMMIVVDTVVAVVVTMTEVMEGKLHLAENFEIFQIISVSELIFNFVFNFTQVW